MIILHLSTWWDLGTSPIGLVLSSGSSDSFSGPTRRPASTSAWMYSLTTLGLADAEGWFLTAGCRQGPARLNPMWKPEERPEWMYDAKAWSGCDRRNSVQLPRRIGDGQVGHWIGQRGSVQASSSKRSSRYRYRPAVTFAAISEGMLPRKHHGKGRVNKAPPLCLQWAPDHRAINRPNPASLTN